MKKPSDSVSYPRHIRDILKDVLRQTGLEEPIRSNAALLCWDGVVGEEIARHARAAYVERDILFVEVQNSVWMHQLQMQETTLKDRLNQVLEKKQPGGKGIQQIRFRLGHKTLFINDDD